MTQTLNQRGWKNKHLDSFRQTKSFNHIQFKKKNCMEKNFKEQNAMNKAIYTINLSVNKQTYLTILEIVLVI